MVQSFEATFVREHVDVDLACPAFTLRLFGFENTTVVDLIDRSLEPDWILCLQVWMFRDTLFEVAPQTSSWKMWHDHE